MQRFYALLLSMIVLAAHADNNSALGKVVQFSSNKGHSAFQFAQSEGGADVMPGCRRLQVEVHYAVMPKTWLPFTHSNYPTKKQTDTAINFLKRALREGREIYFSGVANGLSPAKSQCAFISKALALEYQGDKELIVSFYGKD
jgi:hypothetical protein